MFINKTASIEVFENMSKKLKSDADAGIEKKNHAREIQKNKLLDGINKLVEAVNLLEKSKLSKEADALTTFLDKFAGDRNYSDCIKKLAFSAKENAQSNAILNSVIDKQDADSVLNIELNDDLDDALELSENDEDDL